MIGGVHVRIFTTRCTPMAESPPGKEQLAELFEHALDMAPADRDAWLDEACSDDAQLREKLARLLRADARSHGILDAPPPLIAEAIAAASSSADDSPRMLGPYKVLRSIGVGGMGEVWLAERSDGEFEQRVAVKQVAYPTPGLLQRFRQERQILAHLEHPNIARLLDGGVDARGAPYLVMEYVEGVALTDYAREHALGLPARLRLFLRVCDAVQYAHQNLVVHRDLKPSNILITADGTPKLLDFGIAKVLATTGGNAPTQTHARLLSPDYAAPEQFSGAPITTATDVYALGVVLYELLAGVRPARAMRAGTSDSDPAHTTDPPPPSAALDRSTGAAQRRALRGDLDRITLTALAAEPKRRYASTEAFAADIRRYLDGRPIAARGDSAMYRFRKFVRRNRVAMAAAVLVFAVCITATIVSLHQAHQAREQATRAQAVRAFLVGVFEQASPDQNKGRAITAHELLDTGVKQLEQNTNDPRVIQADLTEVIAGLYVDIGDLDRAQSLLEGNIDQHNKDIPDEIRLRSLVALAGVAERRGTLPAAQDYLRQGQSIVSQNANLDPLDVSKFLQRQSAITVTIDPKTAAPLARAALAYDLAHFGDPSEQLELDWSTLGSLLRRISRDDEALSAKRKALSIARELHGEDHTAVSDELNSLGVTLRMIGDYPTAVTIGKEALAMSTRLRGADHPDTLLMQMNLLVAMHSDGQYGETIPLLLDNLARTRRVLGDDDQRVARTLGTLAVSWKVVGKFSKAEAAFKDAAAIWTKVSGPDSAEGSYTDINLGNLLAYEGRYAEAEVLLRNALRVTRLHFPEASKEVRFARFRLANTLAHTGKPQEAITLVESLLDAPAPDGDYERYILGASQMAFAEAALRLDRASEAQTAAHTALELMKAMRPTDNASIGRAQFLIGRIEIVQHHFDDAEATLRQAIASLVLEEDSSADPALTDARLSLAEALMAAGKRADAQTVIDELHDPFAGEETPYQTELRARLAKLSIALAHAQR